MYQLDEKWTQGQRDAILSRGETLLVSAAAGSGKTAVLTERILSRVLDDNDALDLSTVLVVTFTKAAAAELKSRGIGTGACKKSRKPPSAYPASVCRAREDLHD